MAIRIREFGKLDEAENFLRGGVSGGQVLKAGRVLGLHGLTLTVNSDDITFSDPSGEGLSGTTIAAAIEDATTGIVAFFRAGALHLVEAAPSSGVTVAETGSANPVLGFSSSTASSGTVINASGAAPVLTAFGEKATKDGYYAVIDEA